MPNRPSGPKVQKKFIRGLITQTTALDFPEDACTDIDNCVINRTGLVERRLGFAFEEGSDPLEVTAVGGEAFTEFIWNNPAGIDTKAFVVQQQGVAIYFYEYSTSPNLSPNLKDFSCNLNTLASGGQDPMFYPCQYAIVDGRLVVVNGVCDPFYVTYDALNDTISTTTIILRKRDLDGVDDGLTLNQRVTSTVAALITNNPEHYYNLLNQGWGTADALAQWDAARADVPSNADTVSAYRASETDAFDNARVLASSPGNTPAAKGHFIVGVFDIDRPTAITDDGLAGIGAIATEVEISNTAGAILSTVPPSGGNQYTAAFDGNTNQADTACAIIGNTMPLLLGKDFTGTSPYRITKCLVHGSNNDGYISAAAPGNVTIALYGKTGAIAPTGVTDGVLLGSITFAELANESAARTITSGDTTTYYNYVWLTITSALGAHVGLIAEIRFFTVGSTANPGGLEPFTTAARPASVCQMGGRLFYGGVNDATIGSNIYFTQIITNVNQYGNVYQQNDPTSEVLADLLPDDGGFIRIPEMGQVLKLISMKSSVVVIANNGVWVISGERGQGVFLATGYRVDKVSTVPNSSALSTIDNEGIPVWWTENGIYTVVYDPNYDSYALKDLTIQNIRFFLLSIPALNRRYVKGAYDVNAGMVYWLYNDSESLTTAERYVYNKILCMDILTNAFVVWTLGSTNQVRGIVNIQDKAHNSPARIKYTTTIPVDADTEQITYSEVSGEDYTDWGTDFTSYFVSGYHLDGEALRFFMPLYVIVYLDAVAGSSCFMRGLFDFTTSGSSGKWSTSQQLYNDALLYRSLNYRRLKVRGKGRAMQLKFSSEAGKPFFIIGWALQETADARL